MLVAVTTPFRVESLILIGLVNGRGDSGIVVIFKLVAIQHRLLQMILVSLNTLATLCLATYLITIVRLVFSAVLRFRAVSQQSLRLIQVVLLRVIHTVLTHKYVRLVSLRTLAGTLSFLKVFVHIVEASFLDELLALLL